MQRAGYSKKPALSTLLPPTKSGLPHSSKGFPFTCVGSKALKGMEYSDCCNEINKEERGGGQQGKDSPGRV